MLSLLDNSGRKLLERQIEKDGELSVASLPNGMYFVKISNNQGDRVVKIIKNSAN
jgi:hypothetical protein